MALSPSLVTMARVVRTTTQLGCCPCVLLTAYPFLDPGLNEDIYRHSWICNDGHTRKELDHILTNDRSFFKSIRVFRGAEPPENLDHRLVVATAALQPYKATRKSFTPSSTLHY